MNKIIKKVQFSEKVFLFEIEAPLIAKSRKAGNFVIVRVGENGERMPLTIADADIEKGTITIVVQEVGLSSTKLCNLNEGDFITDVVGPLGNPTHIEKFGTVICAGGGVGVAPMLPIIKALKAAGNRVLSVLAGRNKDLIILEDEVRENSDEVIIMTDDGSAGEKGVVTIGIEKLIQQEHIDKVFAIGPPIMMKFCCLLTQKYNIPTDVSLNTIMVDGTGMCGACRLTIGDKTKFVCIDGPEFDGALVDWDEMFKRMGTFKAVEREEMEHYEEHCNAVLGSKVTTSIDHTPSQYDECDPDVSSLTNRDAEWRKQLRAEMKATERKKIERVQMPELDPIYRATTRLEEVNIGLTPEMALLEAKRCLDCGKPTCVEGCPVNINIPSFIKNIERGHFLDAAKVLKQTSALPAVCGRVCPQEKQCESKCIHLKMGVHFTTDCIVGKTITVDQLESEDYKGIFVGSGAGLPNFMNIPGENAINIMSSNEYLTRVNLMDAANPLTDTPMNLGKKVVVVGGGNTAMDSCRTAKRLGAEVTLVYRRSEAEMPARLEEVKHAKEEGINFLTLHNPKEYLADENGAVKAAVLDVMQLGEPDASGRRSPVATGNTITIDCDQVIVAVGVSPNPLVPNSIQGLQLGRKNTISVDEAMKSSCDSIYAGGDIVRGGATVILAMGDGRRAALYMDKALKK